MVLTLISLALILANPAISILPVDARGLLARHEMSLENRYQVSSVNKVFKDNILLTLKYMSGQVRSKEDIVWDEIEAPMTYEFSLNPGEKFAFHDDLLAEYADNLVRTTNAHFNLSDWFKSDGYLVGDGVCHFASLIYWTAKDAGLTAVAPQNHDFASIPDVPREYGVAVYVNPYLGTGEMQNLYIINTREKPVTFVFEYKDDILSLSVVE